MDISLSPWLIPARAGKTEPSTSSPWAGWAHPRSRGENRPRRQRVPGRSGSSPLARGKRDDDDIGDVECGLIPARAGKTRWTASLLDVR